MKTYGRLNPTDHELARIHNIALHALLDPPVPCQKRLPAASRVAVHEGLSHLLLYAEGTTNVIGKSVAQTMILLAPWLLWPDPRRKQGGKRQPYARQRLIRQKLYMLRAGHWMTLIEEMGVSGRLQGRTPAGVESADQDQLMLRRLKSAARRGRLGQSWKKLVGPRLQPWNETTIAHVQDKWAPKQVPPERPRDVETPWSPWDFHCKRDPARHSCTLTRSVSGLLGMDAWSNAQPKSTMSHDGVHSQSIGAAVFLPHDSCGLAIV